MAISEEVRRRFADIDAAIADTDARLRTIARQNVALADGLEMLGGLVVRQNAELVERVEVLGRFVAVNIDALTDHLRGEHGGS